MKSYELLKKIVSENLEDTGSNNIRWRAIINDIFQSSYKKEKNLLFAALDEGIVEELIENKEAYNLNESRFVEKLIQGRGLQKINAQWTVYAWAYSLGIISNSILIQIEEQLENSHFKNKNNQEVIETEEEIADNKSYEEGLTFFKKNEFESAIQCFQKSAQINPNNPSAWNAMSVAYTKKGDYNSAFKAIETAFQIDPTNERIKKNRDSIIKKLGSSGISKNKKQPVHNQRSNKGNYTDEKESFVSLFLSLFPGLGHVYNGELIRGIIFFIATLVVLFLFNNIIGLIIWAYAAYDAYHRTQLMNKGIIPIKDVEIKHFGAFFFGAILVSLVLSGALASTNQEKSGQSLTHSTIFPTTPPIKDKGISSKTQIRTLQSTPELVKSNLVTALPLPTTTYAISTQNIGPGTTHYSNPNYQFSFDYPETWIKSTVSNSNLILGNNPSILVLRSSDGRQTPGEFIIEIDNKKTQTNLEEYFKNYVADLSGKYLISSTNHNGQIKLGDVKSYEFDFKLEDEQYILIITSYNNNFYILTYHGPMQNYSDDLGVVKKIIESFRFGLNN